MSIYLDFIHSGTLFAFIILSSRPINAMSCSGKEGREENFKLIALAFGFLR